MTDRLEFLYGPDHARYELEDDEIRARLLHARFGTWAPENAHLDIDPAAREIVANFVYHDAIPELWETAERLLAEGVDDRKVLDDLGQAFASTHHSVLNPYGDEDLDELREQARLDLIDLLPSLPAPESFEVLGAVLEIVVDRPGTGYEDLVGEVVSLLGRDESDTLTDELIAMEADELLQEGRVEILRDGRLYHPESLFARVELTHVLTSEEQYTGRLTATPDLTPFLGLVPFEAGEGQVIDLDLGTDDGAELCLTGPAGWLGDHLPDSVLAVRVEGGEAHIRTLDVVPPVDDALVRSIRAAHDAIAAEEWRPSPVDSVVAAVLLDQPAAFVDAQAPLVDLLAAAGLQHHRGHVADHPSQWLAADRAERVGRVLRAHPGEDLDTLDPTARQILAVLDTADQAAGLDWRRPDAEPHAPLEPHLASCLDALRDPNVSELVAVELGRRARAVATGDDRIADPAPPFLAALLDAARRDRDRSTAHLLASLLAEQASDPHLTEAQLHLAHEADPDNGEVLDRLGWYASDKDDIAAALRYWGQLERTPAMAADLDDLRAVQAQAGPVPGRNEPCWCGSGRKYKQCHNGQAPRPALEDRVGRLCRKVVAFIERSGPEARHLVFDLAAVLAGGSTREQLLAALQEPLTLDLAAHEGGFEARFATDRGPILPDDEALLVASWVLVPRSIHEVVDVEPGDGMVLRDLRTGDIVAVAEATLSREASVGTRYCCRVVPTGGERHQIIGGVFSVPVGREAALLDVLDHRDPFEVAEWVAAAEGGPTLVTSEGEALVPCELTFEFGDEGEAGDAVAALDDRYERVEDEAGPRWVEVHAVAETEQGSGRSVRAELELDGTRLVARTTSAERADRLIADVFALVPSARLVADERQYPFGDDEDFEDDLDDLDDEDLGIEIEELLAAARGPDGGPLPPDLAAAMETVMASMEERWCDESIPALGGATPREAAADPTRRDDLERLLATFEGQPSDANAFAMRPARLRELLGL